MHPSLNPIRIALHTLAPSGVRADIIAALGRPITWPTIQHWMAGRETVPQWAYERISNRLRELDAAVRARMATPSTPGERGRKHWQAYHARRAREKDAQAAKEKGAP